MPLYIRFLFVLGAMPPWQDQTLVWNQRPGKLCQGHCSEGEEICPRGGGVLTSRLAGISPTVQWLLYLLVAERGNVIMRL